MNSLLDLKEKDRAHHIHPFTDHSAMHPAGTHVLTGGKGCYLTGEGGERLLDGLAGLWCVNVGYNCAPIVEAVHRQMQALPYYPSFFNSTTEPAILLAEWLGTQAPGRLNKVVFSNSGSEANETALKMIRRYNEILGRPEKRKVLSRTFAYHGVTIATSSLTGLPVCNEPFGLPLADFIHVPGPYRYGAKSDLSERAFGEKCLAETAAIIEREGAETISAMFVEPIQGAGGVIVPPAGYLRGLRELCRENEILFVADEVITAFGRVGAWFASELWELDPDLMTLAKGLTSGYLPLGATMPSDEIVEVINSGGYFSHGFTYSGHPTCCAAALANLEFIDEQGLVGAVRDELGPHFQARLGELADHPLVGEVRGFGLIGAAEIRRAGGEPLASLGAHASGLIREEGAIVRGIRDLIAMSPPLVISVAEIDELFACVRRGLDRLG
jgi:putrescine aminotransferase